MRIGLAEDLALPPWRIHGPRPLKDASIGESHTEGDGGSTSSDAGFMILRAPKVSRKAYSFTQASAFLFPGSAEKSKPRCQTSFNPVPLDQLPKQFPQTADDKNC